MRNDGPRTSGFTLVELLVVIAIIGILVALLLPAVQSAREAARRATCQNNVKQIALALLAYESNHGEFPQGLYGGTTNKINEEEGLGWATKILPQLEQQNVYDQLVNNGVPGFDGNPWRITKGNSDYGIFTMAWSPGGGLPFLKGTDTVIPSFLCPSTDLPEQHPDVSFFGGSGGPYGLELVGLSSYKASRGPCDRGMFFRTLEALRTGVDSKCSAPDFDGDGVEDSQLREKDALLSVRMRDVLDGASNTIGIGEAAYFVGYSTYPTWVGSLGEDGSVLFKTEKVINCNIGGTTTFPLDSSARARLPGDSSRADDCAFSWHVGGAYFGFVDGSVHFLTEDLAWEVFWLLGDRLDGTALQSYN